MQRSKRANLCDGEHTDQQQSAGNRGDHRVKSADAWASLSARASAGATSG
jgi:hypothetical protein